MIRSARVGALLAAFAVHILIAGVLVFFAGRGAPPFERLEPALDVVLVSLPVPEPEPEPVQLEPVEVEAPAPDVPPEAPPEQDTEVESEPEPEPAGDVEPVTVPAEAPVSAESPTPEPRHWTFCLRREARARCLRPWRRNQAMAACCAASPAPAPGRPCVRRWAVTALEVT